MGTWQSAYAENRRVSEIAALLVRFGCGLDRFTIGMLFICVSEDKAFKERKHGHSRRMGRVFVTRAAKAAIRRLATEQS